MNRTKSIIAAGTFTGLILITILALGFGRLQANSEGTIVVPDTVEIAPPATDNMELEQALQEWQDYSVELEQTIQTLQERDIAYQQQLEAANETIIHLEGQVNGANSSYYEEDESHEHEEHEDEEHEYGEYDD
jgi:hypothetical protein